MTDKLYKYRHMLTLTFVFVISLFLAKNTWRPFDKGGPGRDLENYVFWTASFIYLLIGLLYTKKIHFLLIVTLSIFLGWAAFLIGEILTYLILIPFKIDPLSAKLHGPAQLSYWTRVLFYVFAFWTGIFLLDLLTKIYGRIKVKKQTRKQE